jgi:hypothetical protein
MAREKKGSLIKLQGTVGELTFVQSVAYDLPYNASYRDFILARPKSKKKKNIL